MNSNLEIQNYDFFIDREKGKACLVAGGAPTIQNFPYDRFKGVSVLMNEGPGILKGKINADYWICANHYYAVPQKHLKDINEQAQAVFIISDTAMYSQANHYDSEFLKNNIRIPWFAFDDRHLNEKKCSPLQPCCQLVDVYPGRLTIFEFIRNHFGMDTSCPLPNTAAFYSFAFAVIMGCSPIYLQGIELPTYMKDYKHYNMLSAGMFRNMYWVARAQLKELVSGKKQYSAFHEGLPQTLAAFEYLVEICHKQGQRVYNLSRTSKLNEISSLPYLDPKEVGR